MKMSLDTNAMEWQGPWQSVVEQGEPLVRELASELSKQHLLYGVPVGAVGHRQDCDDVLFELLSGTGRFAIVHLTYAQHPEGDSRWSETTLYENWLNFERNRMAADARDWE
jgi:hypothetical protein